MLLARFLLLVALSALTACSVSDSKQAVEALHQHVDAIHELAGTLEAAAHLGTLRGREVSILETTSKIRSSEHHLNVALFKAENLPLAALKAHDLATLNAKERVEAAISQFSRSAVRDDSTGALLFDALTAIGSDPRRFDQCEF